MVQVARPPSSQVRATIVIAEDDLTTRLVLCRILEREKFRVIAVENGKLACEAVWREHPDVVVLDWLMPVMDGRAVLAELQSNEATRGIPIVMLTSHSEVTDRICALEAGVQDFLSKPFDPRELVASIEQQLRRRDYLAADADAAFFAERVAQRTASERRYKMLAEAMPHIVWIADPAGETQYFNHAWLRYTASSLEQAMRAGWASAIYVQDRAWSLQAWSESLATGRSYEVELRLRRASDATYRWHLARAIPTSDESGAITEWVVSCVDIHDYRIASETRAILDTMGSIVSIRTDDGFVDYASPYWNQYTGSSTGAALGLGWRDFIHADDLAVADRSRKAGPHDGTRHYEMRIRGADGKYRWFQSHTTMLPRARGEARRWLDTSTDVDDLKRTQSALARTAAELEHLAHHDAMTKLPNRMLLVERLSQAIALAQRAKTEVLVLYMDLDDFKVINDTRGHAAGDRVLEVTGQRIADMLRVGDMASRVGGDEFVVVCATAEAAGDAARLATRLIEAVRQPIEINGEFVNVGASVGISMYPADAIVGEELIGKADSAMYRAKQSGSNLFRIYEAQAHTSIVAALDFETELRAAIAQRQIVVAFEPIVSLRTNQLIGAEAAPCWRHAQRGLLTGADFLPFAKRHQLTAEIGAIVLDGVCAQIAALGSSMPADFRITMKVPVHQLICQGAVQQITAALTTHGAEPSRLEIAIGESPLPSESATAAAVLAELRGLGIALSIDDFGASPSSLSSIVAFPLRSLKIDRSLVANIATSPRHEAVVTAIVTLAHSLDIEVVAAGVETESQIAALRAHGIDALQGAFAGVPLAAAEFTALLHAPRSSVRAGSEK